jgi:hypothetical protein
VRVARNPRALLIEADDEPLPISGDQPADKLLALDRADDGPSMIANDLAQRSLLNPDDGSVYHAASRPFTSSSS